MRAKVAEVAAESVAVGPGTTRSACGPTAQPSAFTAERSFAVALVSGLVGRGLLKCPVAAGKLTVEALEQRKSSPVRFGRQRWGGRAKT